MQITDNINKLRRQVEDRLRKIPGSDIQKVASLLGLGCTPEGHEYASNSCPKCGAVFCFSCCGWTNVHEGGKHQKDSMTCPVCGYDVLSNGTKVITCAGPYGAGCEENIPCSICPGGQWEVVNK